MPNADGLIEGSDDGALLALFEAIVTGDSREVTRRLRVEPELAIRSIWVGASRQDPHTYFFVPIRHYVYVGDTALHVAAASLQPRLAESLVTLGGRVRARNRRGQEPLHYASDWGPSADVRDSAAQHELIRYLIKNGADPNAFDKSGVAPLHRAVRNRSFAAVEALLSHGADPVLKNKSGSTPLHLAVQNTGKSHSGSGAAKEQQERTILLLLQHGATPTDVDSKGKTVAAAALSVWVRQLLTTH